ncbi:MAG TPA: protoporphyrinogen oxidase [Kofleriaceae bacterium]|nr:protoporphyrinogen oxidase [Kofleriaceae bacterium]
MTAARRAVAVVGGGLAGLAAARRLAARGDVDVTVWEAGARAGGVVETSRAGGFVREHAANGFLLGAADGAADLAEELGLALEPASPAARRRWIYRGGALRALGSPADLLRGELVPLRGLLRALAEPLQPVRRGGGDESIADFVRRRLGAEVLDGLVAPMVTGVFAGDPEQLSLAAAFPKLADLEAEGGLAVASALRALRRAWAGLSSDEPRERARRGIAAPAGGMDALVGALAAGLGERLRLSAAVVAIEVAAGGRARTVRLAGGEAHAADAVVLAVPAPAAARLVSDASGDLSRVLDDIRFAPIAVVHLGYPRAALAADGFGFLVAKGEELRILGAVFESAMWPARAPAGHALVRCMLGGVRDPDVLALSDDELVAQARRDLSRAGVVGLADEPVMTSVVRWPRAIAQYTLGHRERVARAEALAEPLGVVLAGSSYHGVSINACAADARRVEHRVATRLGLPLAALVALATACSSGPKSGPRSAGDAGGVVTAPVTAPPKTPADGSPTDAGEVDVTVEWLSPPAQHVSSPGRNECGAPRRPGLVISSLGGVDGAVVTLEGVSGSGAGSGSGSGSELVLERCQIAPRALLVRGGPLELVNLDERRHDVTLEWVEQGKTAAAPLAKLPVVLVGQRVAVELDRGGVLRAATAVDPGAAAYVAVASDPWTAVTDDRGKVSFRGVPPGRYQIAIWHPPLASGQPPVTAHAAVEVGTAAGASLTVSLAPAAP